jgi:hypothetical protein
LYLITFSTNRKNNSFSAILNNSVVFSHRLRSLGSRTTRFACRSVKQSVKKRSSCETATSISAACFTTGTHDLKFVLSFQVNMEAASQLSLVSQQLFYYTRFNICSLLSGKEGSSCAAFTSIPAACFNTYTHVLKICSLLSGKEGSSCAAVTSIPAACFITHVLKFVLSFQVKKEAAAQLSLVSQQLLYLESRLRREQTRQDSPSFLSHFFQSTVLIWKQNNMNDLLVN